MKFAPLILAFSSLIASAAPWAGTVIEPYNYQEFIPTRTLTRITGTFTVPSFTCGYNGTLSIWAGIGGYWDWDTTLQQIGISLACKRGQPTITAWYEFYPAASHDLKKFDVSAGDVIRLTVEFPSSDLCNLTIENLTTAQTHIVQKSINNALRGSGEWMVEGFGSLPDFGRIDWTNCRAVIRERDCPLEWLYYSAIQQWSQMPGISVTVPGADNESFSITQP